MVKEQLRERETLRHTQRERERERERERQRTQEWRDTHWGRGTLRHIQRDRKQLRDGGSQLTQQHACKHTHVGAAHAKATHQHPDQDRAEDVMALWQWATPLMSFKGWQLHLWTSQQIYPLLNIVQCEPVGDAPYGWNVQINTLTEPVIWSQIAFIGLKLL